MHRSVIVKKRKKIIIINIRTVVTFGGEGRDVIGKVHAVSLLGCWQSSRSRWFFYQNHLFYALYGTVVIHIFNRFFFKKRGPRTESWALLYLEYVYNPTSIQHSTNVSSLLTWSFRTSEAWREYVKKDGGVN